MYVCVHAIKRLAAEPSFTQKMLSMSPIYIKHIKAELFLIKVLHNFTLSSCIVRACMPVPSPPPAPTPTSA